MAKPKATEITGWNVAKEICGWLSGQDRKFAIEQVNKLEALSKSGNRKKRKPVRKKKK